MANPKEKLKAELEAKFKRKYDEKLKQAKEEFEYLLEKAHAQYMVQLKICLQQSADDAMMAADDVFDVNAYSAEKFHVAMIDYVNSMAKLFIEDSVSDPEMVYTKTDIDRRLKQIVGEDNFAPWDERYGGKNG